MKRDWFAILAVVLQIAIILTAAAMLYALFHSY